MKNDRILPYQTQTLETDSGHTFEMQDCASTAVSSFGYKPTDGELAVLFKSDDRVLYVYSGVSSTEIDGLQAASSKGSFIMREIKPSHTVRKETLKVQS